MGQVRADAQGPEAQARKDPRGAAARPLSPHLGIWRWHLTMACSIFHRASGIALYVGALMLAAWAVALASGPDAYASYTGLLGTILGKLVMFGLTVAAFYHLASGLRHLVWDAGHGYDPKTSDLTGAVCIAFGVAAALAVWLIAYRMGAL